ncbi:MAG: C40 family peptidase [Candidatus Goldbacteria bacterium]|nr:C40 family peptidase [Candidatus Goldiibacteriota bacterium]
MRLFKTAVTGVLVLAFIISSGIISRAELYNLEVQQEIEKEAQLKDAVKKPAKKKAKKKPKLTGEAAKREKIVNAAMALIGQDYWPGGTGSEDDYGYDCSGLTQHAYMAAGIAIPKKSTEQYRKATIILQRELKRGDLVFFNTRGMGVNHVGVYIGGGMFVHAPGIGKQIQTADLNKSYWGSRFFGAGRYIK